MTTHAFSVARLNSCSSTFAADLRQLSGGRSAPNESVEEAVREILSSVATHGDQAIIELTNRFDRRQLSAAVDFCVVVDELEAAFRRLSPDLQAALETAAARIRRYHENQALQSWSVSEPDGTRMGQEVRALDRVGIYAPGGRAAYPSTVLMAAIPAKVAGVQEVVMTVPAPEGVLNDSVLGAAYITGVDRVFTIGGAQAVAALAFGTESVPAVDKIVGPGNDYVAAAKRLVYGTVGIDMIAGPSEILIIADGHCPAAWVAMDMCAQAEHDPSARAILLSPDSSYLDAVASELDKVVAQLERAAIVQASLNDNGALIKVQDLDEAVVLSNDLAPEHLELAVRDAAALLPKVRHAGSVFLGAHTPEAFGDYCAGPNHVLPTARTARFASPLGVYDFQKRFSYIECSDVGGASLAKVASTIARDEGLTAHARSAECRLEVVNSDD